MSGSITNATVNSNALNLTSGSGTYNLSAESGTEDYLDSVGGLTVGQLITLSAKDGHTITVRNNANMHLAEGVDFVLDGPYDTIVLRCISTGVMREENRTNIT